MINFDKHLKDLLYKEDFLIIPGVGAFIAAFTPASISESGDLIAPLKTFEFNGLLENDDSHKFLNHVILKENLPKETIETELKNYLYNFKSKLNSSQNVLFADVLSVKRTAGGNLEGKFTSEEDFYKKPDFQKVFAPVGINPEVLESDKNEEVVLPAIIEEPYNEYTAEIEEEYEEEKPWIRYILYLLPLFLIFGALYYIMLYKPFQNSTEEGISNEAKTASVTSTTSRNDSLVMTSPTTDINKLDNSATVVEEIHKALKQGRYQVSAGLFKNKANAEKLVTRMKAAGFEAEIKEVSGMRRVIVAVSTIDEAEAMSNKIEQFTGDKSVYFNEHGISNR